MKNYSLHKFFVAVAFIAIFGGCSRPAPGGWQGYLEGEFIYVAAPLPGRLEKLFVQKGTRVEAGAPLFALEENAEQSTLREAAERMRQSQAKLADLKQGQRPSELDALEARLSQATVNAELSAHELERATKLHATAVMSDDDFDRVRLNHDAAVKVVAEVAAQLTTAKLGGRADAIAAAEADVAAAQAAVDRANWSVEHKKLPAPRSALVYDTLFREGEFVPAGQPIVALLPPENIKVRFFVSEVEFASLKADDAVRVTLSGHTPLKGRVSYLSPQPEYTPPVLYNRDNRSKLVFMIEASLDPAAARDLHPGQPVDVSFDK